MQKNILREALLRQALPARAGIGGENHQTPNPPFWAASLKVWANAHTFPVHALCATCSLETARKGGG
jgi:hypothetical protein